MPSPKKPVPKKMKSTLTNKSVKKSKTSMLTGNKNGIQDSIPDLKAFDDLDPN